LKKPAAVVAGAIPIHCEEKEGTTDKAMAQKLAAGLTPIGHRAEPDNFYTAF
jgi:hypothetical protein